MPKRRQSKNEFRRTNKKGGKNHPTYIYAREGDDYVYLGLTHSRITENVENIRLDKNPNPKDKRPAYVRPMSQKANRSSFGKKFIGWFFSESDKEKIENLKNKK